MSCDVTDKTNWLTSDKIAKDVKKSYDELVGKAVDESICMDSVKVTESCDVDVTCKVTDKANWLTKVK